jgi:hypothetical protein
VNTTWGERQNQNGTRPIEVYMYMTLFAAMMPLLMKWRVVSLLSLPPSSLKSCCRRRLFLRPAYCLLSAHAHYSGLSRCLYPNSLGTVEYAMLAQKE